MKSEIKNSFKKFFSKLPLEIQNIAKNKFKLWIENPFHISLHFKCVNASENIWSIRINKNYRAIGIKYDSTIIWYWIGNHKNYEKKIKGN